MTELRPYQIDAMNQTRQALMAGVSRIVLQLPTGAGKTVIAAEIISSARTKGRKVIFVVPAKALIDQTVQRFCDHGIRDIGVMQADHPLTDSTKPVQVATVQTLRRRAKPEVDLVIVDECHLQDRALIEWLTSPEMAKVRVIGLSATPWTSGMGRFWQQLIVGSITAKMIEAGYLAPFRVFAPSHPDLTGVRTQAGDFHEGDLSKAMDKPSLVADVVETWVKLGENRPTLCFAVDRAHAKSLQEQFRASGVNAGYVDAYTPEIERKNIEVLFHAGVYKVVCNVGVLTTGVDWDVRCIILCRPTKSESLFVQIVGRGLRTAEGKADCLILDHSDTHTRLGFVTDIHHEELDDGDKNRSKAKPSTPTPKECPECKFLRPVRVSTCPNCGFKPKVVSKIEFVDGNLAELRGKGTRASGPTKTIKMGANWVPLADFYAQLKGYAEEHGYQEGWASNQYRQAAGTWPNAYRGVSPQSPTPAVWSWIRSRQIAYAKRRKTQEAGHAAA